MRRLPSLDAVFTHRQFVIELIPVAAIYQRHEALLQAHYQQEGILFLPLLEQAMLEASLTEVASSDALEHLLIEASADGRCTFASREEMDFLRSLYEACHSLWCRPPWDSPDHVIHALQRKFYADGHLLVEIDYSVHHVPCTPVTPSRRLTSYRGLYGTVPGVLSGPR